jgi:hypothetical protein
MKWMPCNERLPNEFTDVLICFTDGRIDVAQLTDYMDISGNPKWCHDTTHFLGGSVSHDDIVAWMPLPNPYTD